MFFFCLGLFCLQSGAEQAPEGHGTPAHVCFSAGSSSLGPPGGYRRHGSGSPGAFFLCFGCILYFSLLYVPFFLLSFIRLFLGCAKVCFVPGTCVCCVLPCCCVQFLLMPLFPFVLFGFPLPCCLSFSFVYIRICIYVSVVFAAAVAFVITSSRFVWLPTAYVHLAVLTLTMQYLRTCSCMLTP